MSENVLFVAQSLPFEKMARGSSVLVTIIIHFIVLSLMIMVKEPDPKTEFMPTIVADFAFYDPEGGIGGSSDNDLVMEELVLPSVAEILAMEEILAPAPEVEEVTPVIESTAPTAAPQPVKPKHDQVKPKEISEDKPQARQAYRAGTVGASAETLTAGGGDGRGSGGTGGGVGRGNPDRFNAYITQIQRKLNRYKKYPPEAKSQGVVGQVKVSFSIDKEGQVTSPRLVESSGSRALDNEVMALLKRISPVPAIPPELNRQSMSLTIPVVFSLN
jgi:protein TonB